MLVFVLTFFTFVSTVAGKTLTIDGLIVSVHGQRFVVAHRPVPGHMPAMTMTVQAKSPGELNGFAPGMRVRFELRDGVARKIQPVRAREGDFPITRPPVSTGKIVPDFELTDQKGKRWRLNDHRGKLVLVQFIYTRCPMPDVCPRLAASFAAVQRAFGERVFLASITIDPMHDTPAVLAAYAERWNAGASWSFLTGTAQAVEEAASHFGLVYWPEDGAITHTSRTALIGPGGKLIALVEGSSFRAGQLVELVKNHLERQQ
jgi:protein SCO1/2